MSLYKNGHYIAAFYELYEIVVIIVEYSTLSRT